MRRGGGPLVVHLNERLAAGVFVIEGFIAEAGADDEAVLDKLGGILDVKSLRLRVEDAAIGVIAFARVLGNASGDDAAVGKDAGGGGNDIAPVDSAGILLNAV